MKARDPLPGKEHMPGYTTNFIYNVRMLTKILRPRPRGLMDPWVRSPDLDYMEFFCIGDPFYLIKSMAFGRASAASPGLTRRRRRRGRVVCPRICYEAAWAAPRAPISNTGLSHWELGICS